MAQLGKNTVIKLMGVEIKLQFADDGTKQLTDKLERLRIAGNDFSPAFEEFDKTVMMPGIDRTFQQQGRPLRWQPLAEATVKDRIRKGYGGTFPILERTGALRRGFRSRVGKRSYAVFNRVKWYKWNQFGTPTIPARPMVVVLVGQRRRFTEIARKHLGIDE